MDPERLPPFPLPVVLLPGALMPLRIFEPRYRRMVSHLLEGGGRFGLYYHDPDEHGPFVGETGRVGCVAGIERHHPLPDGRSVILVRGRERISIRRALEADALYYEAVVRVFQDEPAQDQAQLVARRERSLRLFRTAMETLPHVPESLPELDPGEETSCRLAAVLRMDPFWQQELLELRDEAARLDRLDPVFQAGLERWWQEGGSRA